MKYKAYDIIYDTDGEDIDLPTEMEIEVPDDVNEYWEDEFHFISNEISDRTGFCHYGFNAEKIAE